MKHRVKGKKLNRSVKHRKALFKNLVTTLIEKGEVRTTEAKAKAIKGLFDKLMTKARLGTVHARRVIGGFLQRRSVANRLVDSIAPKVGKRTSGFTRIVRLGRRRGDDAMMVKMELVDRKKADVSEKKSGEEKKGGKKKAKQKGKIIISRASEKEKTKSQTDVGRKVDAAVQLRGER